jgi:hypothetical protein
MQHIYFIGHFCVVTTCLNSILREPFQKFVDSLYYSESELYGGAVTVSFYEVRPLASDVLLTTLHPLLEIVLQTVCRNLEKDSGTGGFLPRSSLFMIGKAQKSHGARSGLYGGCPNGVPPISVSASIATSAVCGLASS